MPTIALDALGAERGVDEVVRAARIAAGDGIRIRLVGPASELRSAALPAGVEAVEAGEPISNEDEPVAAVRARPDASIVRAVAEVAEGRADAIVSAGSTGATMAAATFGLKRIRGVHRPALAAQLPVPGSTVLFLDCGANVEVRPQHLVQFAYMGAAFSTAVLGVPAPRVGLLSVGEESRKGTPVVVEARERLERGPGIDFVGNIEGGDIPAGSVDVVVTDGFTGNVSLKLMEGTARSVAGAVRDAARSGPIAMLGGLLIRPALGRVRRQLDPDTTGGAILLGLRAVAVVAHGGATAEGIANAVRLAGRSAEERAVERTAALLEAGGALRAAARGRPSLAREAKP